MQGFENNKINYEVSVILLQMTVPQEATGFVEDIINPLVSEKRRIEALNRIEKYNPEQVSKLKEAFGYDAFYEIYGYVNNFEDILKK